MRIADMGDAICNNNLILQLDFMFIKDIYLWKINQCYYDYMDYVYYVQIADSIIRQYINQALTWEETTRFV